MPIFFCTLEVGIASVTVAELGVIKVVGAAEVEVANDVQTEAVGKVNDLDI